jgi:hypothetical protein
MTYPRLLLTVASVTALLSGCATQNQSSQPGQLVDASEYEYVTPVGSNIPVRVRKGTAPQTSSPTTSISGETAQNMMHGAPGQAMVDKSGR